MTVNDKYNKLVHEIGHMKEGTTVEPKNFGSDPSEFKDIIKEIESDGLFKKGYDNISNYEYIFSGLTFKGHSFIEVNDKKEYIKMEKTEINHTTNISIGRDNIGNIVTGDENTVTSEYELKFNSLIEAINNSSINDKDSVIKDLQSYKDDKKSMQSFLGNLLTRGAEITSIAAAAGALFGSL